MSHMISALCFLSLFFFQCSRYHRDLHSFPTRRSSDLNIRELQNFIERSVILTSGNVLESPLASLRSATEVESLGPITMEDAERSEEHTSELQSHSDLVCRLLLEKKKK